MTDVTKPRGDVGPPPGGPDEKTTLLAFLDYLREAVAAKLDGLSEEEARTPGVASGTNLLGLVRHLTGAELNWFVWGYAGEDITPASLSFTPDAGDTIESVRAAYREATARCNAIAAACDDLAAPGVRARRSKPGPSLRWILVHMIEETARHAGHADILRERLDGATGR
ncbi:DinB superfamily protein [Actinomadura rubteroloni]|uniref:DinB superfamily protein n=1 Tax=Actinomadura rubteroloni TaxID=1926885 RepID=A0A2P4ULV6_9ACTN|nr:DinB superfamily protein [Actinomadura rubteroloni]